MGLDRALRRVPGPAGGDLSGSYPNPNIAIGAITQNKIADDAVTKQKIKDDAVITTKILDLNVTSSKLADGAVTTLKVADGAITTTKVLDGSITAAKLAAGVIPTSLPPGGNVCGDGSGSGDTGHPFSRSGIRLRPGKLVPSENRSVQDFQFGSPVFLHPSMFSNCTDAYGIIG